MANSWTINSPFHANDVDALAAAIDDFTANWDDMVEGIDPAAHDAVEASRAQVEAAIGGLHHIAEVLRAGG